MASGNDIAVLVVTEAGLRLATKLRRLFPEFTVYAHSPLAAEGMLSFDRVGEIVDQLYGKVRAFVFIMASGIAVRTLAPLLTDKKSDPGAVVIDETGEFVISLIGGHEGGANTLAARIAAGLGGRAVITTGSEAAKPLVVGVGCRKNASAESIIAGIDESLNAAGFSRDDIKCLATVEDKKGEAGLLAAAECLSVPIRFITKDEIRRRGRWTEASPAARRALGIDGVCEPAALLTLEDSTLILPKQKFGDVTVAVAAANGHDRPGKGFLALVGISQGGERLTPEAVNALSEATDIVGYTTYIKAIDGLIQGKSVHKSGMGGELDRAGLAVRLARAGRKVAVVSSGDAGIYGMAGPVLEVLGEDDEDMDIRIVPGITAASAAAAAVGAPLMNDFAVISLSDLLTPWPVIEKRLEAAAAADMVIVLYNPRSRGRADRLSRASALILKHRAPKTPAAIVRNAGIAPEVRFATLAGLPCDIVDMRATVIIGNSETRMVNGRMITGRGYRL